MYISTNRKTQERVSAFSNPGTTFDKSSSSTSTSTHRDNFAQRTDRPRANRCESTLLFIEMATSSLVSSLRALSLGAAPAVRQALRTQQPSRNLSQTAFTPSTTARPTATAISTTRTLQAVSQQQARGMKVHSSVKKRCEHCKVSHESHRHPLVQAYSSGLA
ncbi:hypothetical protein GGR52DRAFT_259539 [Hypoxylon sp. FL1284]|nr:hypothetical protein GGR52DRAFT_259539 [Hypoxylon sp. FL1284]